MLRLAAIAAFVAFVAVANSCPTISGAPTGVGLSGIPQYWSTIDVPGTGQTNLSFSFCTPWISPPMQWCGNQNTPSYVAENAGRSGCGTNMWNTFITPWYWGQDQQAHAVFSDGTGDGYLGIIHVGCGTTGLSLVSATAVSTNNGYNWTMSLESSYMCSGASTCGQWNDCYSCTTAPSGNCGWCANSGMCSQGTSTGPNQGTCSSWEWVSGNCQASPTAAPMTYAPSGSGCSSWTSCYDCTTAPSGNCGWCANSNTCSQGTATGPNMGSCISWDWLSSECPATPPPTTMAPDHCAGYTTCATCTTASAPYCGWCANSNTCSSGTANGPSTGSCVSWDWLQNECPAGAGPKLPEPVGKPHAKRSDRGPHNIRPKA